VYVDYFFFAGRTEHVLSLCRGVDAFIGGLLLRLSLQNRLGGRGMSAYSKYDVAFFIDNRGGARWSHLLREFVEDESERHISRQKLSDYLKELCDEGLVQKTVDKKALALRMLWRVYPVYVVPKSRKKRLSEIRDKREIYEFIDSASAEEIKKLHEEVKHLRETEEKQ
jgi:hypothetical protein